MSTSLQPEVPPGKKFSTMKRSRQHQSGRDSNNNSINTMNQTYYNGIPVSIITKKPTRFLASKIYGTLP